MAKFHGVVGYATQEELRPGVIRDVISERTYYGDVVKDTVKWNQGERFHKDLSLANTISILADAYAYENVNSVRYVYLAGAYWTVADVIIQRPRLIFRLGGIYNGEKAQAPAGAKTNN